MNSHFSISSINSSKPEPASISPKVFKPRRLASYLKLNYNSLISDQPPDTESKDGEESPEKDKKRPVFQSRVPLPFCRVNFQKSKHSPSMKINKAPQIIKGNSEVKTERSSAVGEGEREEYKEEETQSPKETYNPHKEITKSASPDKTMKNNAFYTLESEILKTETSEGGSSPSRTKKSPLANIRNLNLDDLSEDELLNVSKLFVD